MKTKEMKDTATIIHERRIKRLIDTLDDKIPNWRKDVLDEFLNNLLAS